MLTNNIYLALGDSISAGFGVGRKSSFPAQYYTILLPGFPGLRYINAAVDGYTSTDLARLLRANRRVANLVAQASLISISIGSNDLLALGKALLAQQPVDVAATQNALNQNLADIGARIRSLNPRARVQAAAIYNPLPAGPFAHLFKPAQTVINQANGLLAQWSTGFGFELVPVDQAFKGREPLLIGPDYFHPNATGHLVIAQTFARL
ncbi:MAG TPA: SGNH/GDSL hydrolase family protein [Verrucomicrobiae bacterium]|nr:SGNH/GDSL hydrolase family protein [Verrucomicrobiae bacterium]